MCKRFMIIAVMLATLGAGALTSSPVAAHHGYYGRGHYGGYYRRPVYVGPPVVLRGSYYPATYYYPSPYYYGPPAYYGSPYYGPYYGGPSVGISVGF